jgi:hypothetical protein
MTYHPNHSHIHPFIAFNLSFATLALAHPVGV